MLTARDWLSNNRQFVTKITGTDIQEAVSKGFFSSEKKKNGGNGFNTPKNCLIHSPTPKEVEK
jgi:hypothetical protein